MIPHPTLSVTPSEADEILGTVGDDTFSKVTLVLRNGKPFCPWREWQATPFYKVLQLESINTLSIERIALLEQQIRERDQRLSALALENEDLRRVALAATPAATPEPLALEVGSPTYAAERAAATADVNRGTQTVVLNQQGKPRKYSTKPIRPCPYCNREDFLDAYARNGHVGKCKAKQPAQPVEQPVAEMQPAESEPEIVLQDGEEGADVVALPL